MVTLIVESVISFEAKPVPQDSFDRLPNGTILFSGADSGASDTPETGSICLLVYPVTGAPDEIDQVIFLFDNPITGTVEKIKSWPSNSYELHINVNAVYFEGFKSAIVDNLPPQAGLVGFSERDKLLLNSFEAQQDALDTLLDFICPSKKQVIRDLSRKCLIMHSTSAAEGSLSHFDGPKSLPNGECVALDSTGEKLSHILTLNLSEVLMVLPDCNLGRFGEHLSFYLSTSGLEQRWPDQDADRVIHIYDATDEVQVREEENVSSPIQFQPFLDLPDPESTIIDTLDFSEDDKETYSGVLQIYLLYLFDDCRLDDRNKLFGYPDIIQTCPVMEAEMANKKIPYAEVDLRDALQWHQLFQLTPGDRSLHFSGAFGDANIYVMIREYDLEKGDFSNVQVVVQNT